jgi:serine/threonine-protein kinase
MEEPAMVERFLREARSAARLRGEHVCRVTDFGTSETGVPFMVMEFLEGVDLATMVDDNGALDATRVATYLAQACIGIAEAHALGIIHRDLKPGNLFLTRGADGRELIKLLDFGIAKATSAIDPSLTATQKAMGSPAYMSPEQLRAHSTVDPRSDVWSLGVTMYELLTEHRPFEGDTPYELALSISNDPPKPLPETVNADIAKVVMRCLEKDREKRYQNVAELAAGLAPIATHGKELAARVAAALSPNAPKPRSGSIRDADPATETTMRGASGSIDADAPRKRSKLAIPIALVAVAAIAVTAFFVWPRGDEPTVTPAPVAAPQPQPAPPPPTPDAATVVEDAPAPEPDAAEAPVDKPVDKPVKPPKKRPKQPKPNDPTDFGKSRF